MQTLSLAFVCPGKGGVPSRATPLIISFLLSMGADARARSRGAVQAAAIDNLVVIINGPRDASARSKGQSNAPAPVFCLYFEGGRARRRGIKGGGKSGFTFAGGEAPQPFFPTPR